MAEIIPGIYESDKDEIIRKIDMVAPFAPWIQLDINDESLGGKPSLTDPKTLAGIISSYPDHSFEAHLMVSHPEKFIRPLALAGFKRIIAHVEAIDPRLFLDEAEYESIETGMAIDGPTELDLIEPYLEQIDMVLVMGIELGDSGKPFMPEVLDKVRVLKENNPDLPIEIDGGMNETTAKLVRDAGVSFIVSTNFLFTNHAKSIRQGIDLLSGK